MNANQLMSAVEHFRQLDPEMPSQMVLCFLIVAENPGITLTKLGERAGIVASSVTRNIYSLSRIKSKGISGHDLVDVELNPESRREKLVSLSAKGKRFYGTLMALIS
ncbi:MAG: hypothetical protein QOF78_788 [Phycisphaerales bacterium]|jgi:DNA-binding MarR family transcriptional regulator|nr:hypothetical protein [Phycisphaerales bacterium]